ncbi:hypothetical protein ATE49_13905 [Elizabethkingia miricola]|uniref:Glycosyltransferase involved in cell wall biosynthesis n=1 Tax=Elizabethkingia miricola TaxID=172045 RepID=A0ABY3NDU2_ELIMR|nr:MULTISPECIES: glycosyltransferase family 4 protein [Elizabethkingia]OBS13155.1 hypothetical protein ATE49_13905 [Elizabethkingia miricola]TYO89744.1 glycosyltransferase involved in cell wall biosynthesis [Elizabethkingia miricola]
MDKRILHVVSVSFSLPYFIGEQFTYFRRKTDYTFYVACSPSEELSDLSEELQFTKVPLPINRAISPIQDLKAIFLLRKFIRENKIDIVVGHTPKGGMIAMLAAYLAGLKNRVYFRHGIMFETSRGIKRFILKSIEQMTGFFATKVVCVSNEIKSISEREHLSNKKKNILLGRGTCNGVDCDNRFNPENYYNERDLKDKLGLDDTNFVVGYVGRLVKDKGTEDLVNAWSLVTDKYPQARLLLVGPFEDRDAVSEEVKNKIVDTSSIIHTGLVKNTEDYYAVMDAFILPSYREGFPTVILEASSMGLPILTTRATGCSEAIIENETGIFFDIESVKIYEAIEYFINNRSIARQMGENGRNFVKENFEQSYIWRIIENKILST